MKRTAPALLFGALVLFAQHLSAQFTTTVQAGNKGFNSKYLGNDVWFCIPQNLSGSGKGQFYHVYVASDKNTIVHFQVQGQAVIKKPLTKNKVIDFTAYPPPQTGDFNVGAFLGTSGQIETDKAIHVWSDNADLSVYLLARAPFSTDGMYVVPVTGWGTEYVVASYIGVDDFSFSGTDEWPSEFTVVANQDGTNVTITPAWDIRQNGQPKVTAHPKGQPFQVALNKGDCVQFQTIVDQNNKNYDLTGTYIKSDKPIGVIGASAAPYIPAPWVNPGSPDQSCCGDLVMDMMQPVRTWSNSYFTVPFANRPYSGDLFLVVGTKKNQVILRNGSQATILDSNSAGISPWKFKFLMDIHEASLWTSTDPFMLVQYMEGDWWDELGLKRPQPPKKQAGDPCDVVINANSQFTNKIIFQTPVIPPASQEADFQNFVNLIIQHDHLAKTTFDGIPLTPPLNIPNISKVVTFANIGGSGWDGIQLLYKTGFGQGTHIVQSDTGVGVYIYGQANDESYAWSGALGIRTINDPDTVPPVAIFSGSCFRGHLKITDPGSKLSSFIPDSVFNMRFIPDSNFIPGNDSSYYDVSVIDSTDPAYLSVTIYDIAGNMTTVLIKYQPQSISFKPNPLNFGKVLTSATEYLYDTVINNSQNNITFNSSALHIGGTHGFSLDSIGADGSLAPGQMRIFKIKFIAPDSKIAADTLTLNSDCLNFSLLLLANNVPDYSAADFNFGCIDTGTTKTVPAIVLTNLYGGINITIDSLYIEDTKHFSDTIQYPFALASQRTLVFSYTATAIENDTTIVHFISHTIGERTAKLIGCGQAKAGVGEKNYSSSLPSGSLEYSLIASQLDRGSEIAILPPVPNPVVEKKPVHFVFGLSNESSLDLSLYDILGNHAASILHEANHPAGIYELGFPAASDLPAGMYFYRLAALGKVISGKLVIGK